jgi:hypothetical protein
MELRHGRDSGNAFASKLRQLLSFGGVYVHEAIHVADAEALDAVLGKLLPLGS